MLQPLDDRSVAGMNPATTAELLAQAEAQFAALRFEHVVALLVSGEDVRKIREAANDLCVTRQQLLCERLAQAIPSEAQRIREVFGRYAEVE